MKTRFIIFLFSLVITIAGCVSHQSEANVNTEVDTALSELPGIYSGHYKAAPYLKAAATLQSLDHKAALKRLHVLAGSKTGHGQVIVLCRMLFTSRTSSDFRRPMLGAACFLGKTGYSDWPLEPIEVVDGVPFLITRGYDLGGLAEPAEWYVHYCETNCDWSSFRYSVKSEQDLRNALGKLIFSPKWKLPLNAYEYRFLEEQVLSTSATRRISERPL